MLGGRLFYNKFAAVSVQNQQDLLGYVAAANKGALIEAIEIGPADPTPTSAMNLQMSLYLLTATVTGGTGGTTNALAIADGVTPASPGALAAAGSAWQNATSQATTTGTKTQVLPLGAYLFTGYRLTIPVSIALNGLQAAVWTLDANLPFAAKMSAWMLIRELGNGT